MDTASTVNNASANPALAAALEYLTAGWQPTPIHPFAKNPELAKWDELRMAPSDLSRYFRPDHNVGILCGAPSNGLIDVDIDHDSAKKLARLLPPTDRVHGRPSNPDSHYWYLAQDAKEKTVHCKDPETGEMLIEFRSTGGQTVVPPSQYRRDDGKTEMLSWAKNGQPGIVQGGDLLKTVHHIAAIALIGKHWPGQGSRNESALALSGALLRSGVKDAEAEEVVRLVCEVANDEEHESRVRCVAATRDKLAAGEPVTGYTRLCALLGDKVVPKAMEWLALSPVHEQHTWEPPILFDQANTPEFSPNLLPSPFGDFASALAANSEVPMSMAVMAVMGSVASCVNKRFAVVPQAGWQEPLNVYILIALPPGNNKSLVKRECVAPIDMWEFIRNANLTVPIQQAQSKRRNEEAQITSLRHTAAREKDPVIQQSLFTQVIQLESQITQVPIPPKVYVNDATPESLARIVNEQRGRLSVISDEGGVFEVLAGLYNNGRSNPDIILKGIDGGRVRIERKDSTIDINPHLAMLLLVQPRIIQNMAAQRSFQGNGLLERFLYLIPKSPLGFRKLNGPPIPNAVKIDYSKALTHLLDIPRQEDPHTHMDVPRIMQLDLGAFTLWETYRAAIEPQLQPGKRFDAAGALGWAGKASGYCLRVAGLLQVMETGEQSKIVSVQNMTNAIDIMRVLCEHAMAAFGAMQLDQPSQDAEAVAEWIAELKLKKFRRTECFRKFHGRFTGKKRLDAAMTALIDRNIISPAQEETTTPGRRATTFYEVNPELFKPGQP